jgi:sugar phosphate isomerase/epimerase
MTATLCLPTIWSFLNSPLSPEPSSPRERLDSLLRSLERLAPLHPVCVYVTSGALGDRDAVEARRIVEDGLERVADRALELGLNVGFEPIRRSSGGVYSEFDDSFELIDGVGASNLWFVFDVWHLWDVEDLHAKIARHAARTIGVQVNDWRKDTRGWCDRTYPGSGIGDVPGILRAFEESGYRGWYDLELLSDDGTRGTRYPDSLWSLDPREMLDTALNGYLGALPTTSR